MRVVITLAIHLVWCAIWRRGVSRVLKVTVAVLLELLNASRGRLGIGQGLARQVGSRWVGVEQNGQLVDNQRQGHHRQGVDHP